MIDIMVLALEPKMSDEEIKDNIRMMLPICISRKAGFCLTISGFDSDKRELWQIPEAIAFMKRLVDFGLIACLEVSTSGKFTSIIERYGVEELPGFGALEVWLGGTQQLASGDNNIEKTTMDRFFDELKIANSKAKAICNQESKISDGYIRHSCPKKWKGLQ